MILRAYNLAEPGKILLTETVRFKTKSNLPGKYEYRLTLPDAPTKILKQAIDKLAGVSGDESSVYFQLPASSVEEQTINILAEVSVAATPTLSGAQFDMKATACLVKQGCSIVFTGLAPGSEIQLISTNENRPAIVKQGQLIALTPDELKGMETVRIVLRSETMKTAAWQAWSKSSHRMKATATIRLRPNGVITVEDQFSSAPAHLNTSLTTLSGIGAHNRYLLADLTGIEWTHFSEYSSSSFYLSDKTRAYGYSIINAVVTQKDGKQRIILPISALKAAGATEIDPQSITGFITDRQKISIEGLSGLKVKTRIARCTFTKSLGCEIMKPVASVQKDRDNATDIEIHEAQVTGLWMLIVDVVEGKISEPDTMTRLRFAFAHYHKFGEYPRWVFWFYFLSILAALTLLIIFFSMRGRKKRAAAEQRKIADMEEITLRDLIKRDPSFNAADFKKRGMEISEKIQHAWSAGDMRECRRYLSQGVYNRFRIQLRIMREMEKKQNAMADFKIKSFNIVSRHRSGPFDSLTVRLDAEARDTMVSSALPPIEATKAAQAAPIASFTEYYTFMRRRDAKTSATGFDACSRCGTPFSAEGEITKCKSCGAVMGSGTHDWVLAEITQAVEHNSGKRVKISGDSISPDRIEDRASFVFWRDVMFNVSGKKDSLLRDATDEYLTDNRSAALWKDIAVGAADIEAYDDTASPMTASVRIKWSAQGPGDKEIRHRQSVLSLVNTPTTAEGSGFAEHSCETCGAPLPETDAEACSYCRSPMQRKNKDWLLNRISTTIE